MATSTVKSDELNDMLDEMVSDGIELSKRFEVLADDGRDMLWNHQLAGVDPVDLEGWDWVQCNDIYPAVMQEVSALAQRQVVPHTEAQDSAEPGDVKAAGRWGPVLRHWYERDAAVPEQGVGWLLSGRAAGHWLVGLTWQPHFEWVPAEGRWRGSVVPRLLRTAMVAVDPDCQRTDFRDARYIRFGMRVDAEQLAKRYPQHKEAIENATKAEWQGGTPPLGMNNYAGYSNDYVSPAAQMSEKAVVGRLWALLAEGAAMVKGGSRKGGGSKLTVEYIFWRDDAETTETVPGERLDVPLTQVGRDGIAYAEDRMTPLTEETWPRGEEAKVKVPKYPNGRYVMRLGGKTILNSTDEAQKWPYRVWPLVAGVNTPLPFTWRGLNAVEMVRDLQAFKNRIYTRIVDFIEHHVNPALVVEEGALVEGENVEAIESHIRVRPGRVIRARAGRGQSAVTPLARTELSSTIWQVLAKVEEQIRDILGSQTSMMGKAGAQPMTAREAMSLAAEGRMRTALQSICWDQFVVRLLYAVGAIMQHEMAGGDIMRLAGAEDGSRMTELDDAMGTTPFEVSISTTSAMPYDREREKMDITALLGILANPAAIYVLEWVLDAFKVPNKDELIAQFKAAQMMQAGSPSEGSQSTEEQQSWQNEDQAAPENSLPQTQTPA